MVSRGSEKEKPREVSCLRGYLIKEQDQDVSVPGDTCSASIERRPTFDFVAPIVAACTVRGLP